MNRRAAFTYIELMVVVIIIAIISVVAMPMGDSAAKEQGRLAGELFAADVAFARSLAIARPDDPVVIKMDTTNNRYWLARAATPDVPITHPQTKKPYVVTFGPAGQPGLEHVQVVAYEFGGDAVLGFDALGATDQQTPAIVQMSSAGEQYEVQVQPSGSVADVHSGFTIELMMGGMGGGEGPAPPPGY